MQHRGQSLKSEEEMCFKDAALKKKNLLLTAQSFNPALICTLPDLCLVIGAAAACADVLYRLTPTTTSTSPGPASQASSLILITTPLHA